MRARARQPQDEPGPSDLHQFDRATFLAARCHGRDRHFHEHRPTRTTAACRPASLKSAFQIVVTEIQPRRRGAQPVVPRTLGRRLPEFLRDALAPSPARSPRRETLRQRLLAAGRAPWHQHCRPDCCHRAHRSRSAPQSYARLPKLHTQSGLVPWTRTTAVDARHSHERTRTTERALTINEPELLSTVSTGRLLTRDSCDE